MQARLGKPAATRPANGVRRTSARAALSRRTLRRTSDVKAGDAFTRGRTRIHPRSSVSFMTVISNPPWGKVTPHQIARARNTRLHRSGPNLQDSADFFVRPLFDLE